jgi:hypothetical protein
MLAVNSAGRELKGAESARFSSAPRLDAPPPMVTLAQFMYISL